MRRDGAEDRSSERSSFARDALLVVVLALAATANTLANRIVYDDRLILENADLRSPWSWKIWASNRWGETKAWDPVYRPLSNWTLALNGWLNERVGLPFESVTGFHVFNALAHAATAVLVLLFLREAGFGRFARTSAAATFAVLAIHVEAVTPIIGRADVLATGFGVAFLVLHLRRASTVGAIACLVASLACKESGLAFVPAALLVDLCVRRGRPPIARHVAYVVALVAFGVARWSVVHGAAGDVYFVDNPLVSATTIERVLTAAAVQVDYLATALVPVNLRSDASFDAFPVATSVLDARVVAFAVVLAGLVAWSVLAWRRGERRVGLCVAGWAVLFAPASNFVAAIGTIRGERLAYAPSLFLCALLAVVAERVATKRRPIAIVLVAVLVAANLALSLARNRTWRDPATFFRAQVAESPRSAKAHYNLATELAAEGDDVGAIAEHERALAIFPGYHEALHNLGNALRRRGEPERALACYREALERVPSFLPAAFGVVEALHDLRRDDDARAMLSQIERRAPTHPWLDAHKKLVGAR